MLLSCVVLLRCWGAKGHVLQRSLQENGGTGKRSRASELLSLEGWESFCPLVSSPLAQQHPRWVNDARVEGLAEELFLVLAFITLQHLCDVSFVPKAACHNFLPWVLLRQPLESDCDLSSSLEALSKISPLKIQFLRQTRGKEQLVVLRERDLRVGCSKEPVGSFVCFCSLSF